MYNQHSIIKWLVEASKQRSNNVIKELPYPNNLKSCRKNANATQFGTPLNRAPIQSLLKTSQFMRKPKAH